MPRSKSALRREVQAVTQQLAGMRVRGRSRSRGRRPRSQSRRRSQSRGSRSRTRVPRPQNYLDGGEIVVQHTEMLAALITVDKNVSMSISLSPTASTSQAGHLKALAALYSRYRYESLVVEYQPAVGSNLGGTLALGYFYGAKAVPSGGFTWGTVDGCMPNLTTAMYQKARMTVPVSKMSPQTWLTTNAVSEADIGTVLVHAEGDANKAFGYLRIKYRIRLAGPHG